MSLLFRLRPIGAIAQITMLEGARKQMFHVLMLMGMTMIAISTLLGYFDKSLQVDIVTDLCLVAILSSSGIIAITLSVSGVPSEIENKTVYPILARPMARWQYIVGKFLGVIGTITIGLLILFGAFVAIIGMLTGTIPTGIVTVAPFILLESAILAAVAICLSTFSSPPLAWFLAITIYIIGNVKFRLYGFLTQHDHSAIGKILGNVMYQVVPNLECFNFKDSLVHGIPVSPFYMVQTALYGILYCAFLLTGASLVFGAKEL
jgi:ABC-type transport system involved in multi-copper enzyme maturation permease subunit